MLTLTLLKVVPKQGTVVVMYAAMLGIKRNPVMRVLTQPVHRNQKWAGLFLLTTLLFAPASNSQIILSDDHREVESLSGKKLEIYGKSELHIMGGGMPVQKSRIEVHSEDAWIFLPKVRPSDVAADILSQVRVNGKSASIGGNVRVVQYGEGTVIIPHPEDYLPLEVFSAKSYTGTSQKLEQYTPYDAGKLGAMAGGIRSFVLKRGYMATFAENEDGTGHSKCYVAQDHDMEVAALPENLDNRINFVRIFPWRWISKKGSCDVDPTTLDAKWNYNWNLNRKSTLDWEYVAIKQHANWPGLDRDWKELGVNHLLGYNEPNNKVEDGYKNLNPPGSVDNAVECWPDLLKTGLRVGSPAVTDGGRGWILDFMKKARAKNYRVDFVAIHYYRSFWKKDDPEGAAQQLYNFLKDIHDQTGLPIWLTEWNNGANWTDNNHDPSPSQQEKAIEAMVRMLDETPWVERYAIYSNVEDFRKVQLDGSLTGAGEVYHDQPSPIGYQQEYSEGDRGSSDAIFLFENDCLDVSGNGNNGKIYGDPRFAKVGNSRCIAFDGENTYVRLPPRSAGQFGNDSAFSFSGWIRWAGGDIKQRIFDFSDEHGDGFYLSPSTGTSLEFGIKNGTDGKTLTAKALKPGAWTHIAVTISGGRGKLYVNGECVKESPSMTIHPSNLATKFNYIGRHHEREQPFFKGQIFEARFLSNELTDERIKGLATRISLNFDDKNLKFSVSGGMGINASLEGLAKGGKGPLTYSKSAGPEWLTVHPDGRLEGKPSDSDEGENHFIVIVQDTGGRIDAREMIINVRGR